MAAKTGDIRCAVKRGEFHARGKTINRNDELWTKLSWCKASNSGGGGSGLKLLGRGTIRPLLTRHARRCVARPQRCSIEFVVLCWIYRHAATQGFWRSVGRGSVPWLVRSAVAMRSCCCHGRARRCSVGPVVHGQVLCMQLCTIGIWCQRAFRLLTCSVTGTERQLCSTELDTDGTRWCCAWRQRCGCECWWYMPQFAPAWE